MISETNLAFIRYYFLGILMLLLPEKSMIFLEAEEEDY
jgi:hypothetical protein